MNYIELINRYWQEVETKGWTPVETNIYFRLLDICNKLGWRNPFTLSNPRAVALMAVTENTLAAGRDKLAMKGLIGFRKGSRRSDSPTYCFPEKIDGEWVFPESFTAVFTSNIEAKHGVKPGAKHGVKPGAKHGTYNKTKTETKTKDMSPDGDGRSCDPPIPSLFAEEEKKTRKKPTQSKSPPLTPTLDEVLDYFLSQDADKRLENWEESARRFFDNFNAVDWRDKYNRRITRWDSRANSWILSDESRQKERTKNEPNSINRRPTTEDTLTDEQYKLAERIALRRNRQKNPGGYGDGGEIP